MLRGIDPRIITALTDNPELLHALMQVIACAVVLCSGLRSNCVPAPALWCWARSQGCCSTVLTQHPQRATRRPDAGSGEGSGGEQGQEGGGGEGHEEDEEGGSVREVTCRVA